MSETPKGSRSAKGRLLTYRRKLASASERINARLFREVHRRNLLYNTCWEDPALDRVALNFQPGDRVAVITSAGCNALDYLLAGAGEVNAIDMNPIQNALLELKRAGIRSLDHGSFFELFGDGHTARAGEMYHDALRAELSPVARGYWDRHLPLFFMGRGWRRSFYYRGTSGLLAKLMLSQLAAGRLKKPLEKLLRATTVAEQRDIYETHLRKRLWKPWLNWFLSRSTTLSLAGVPEPQRLQIVNQYPGGVSRFIRDCVEAVITELPFSDNYFWRVYLQGHYEPACCPEYLTKVGFTELKSGKINGLNIHTSSVTEFLRGHDGQINKFILLDHMDWMSLRHDSALSDEWTAILAKSAPGSRAIFRSAGLRVDYLHTLPVKHHGRDAVLGDLLTYHRDLAAELHRRDRVHTYGSFSIADLPA